MARFRFRPSKCHSSRPARKRAARRVGWCGVVLWGDRFTGRDVRFVGGIAQLMIGVEPGAAAQADFGLGSERELDAKVQLPGVVNVEFVESCSAGHTCDRLGKGFAVYGVVSALGQIADAVDEQVVLRFQRGVRNREYSSATRSPRRSRTVAPKEVTSGTSNVDRPLNARSTPGSMKSGFSAAVDSCEPYRPSGTRGRKRIEGRCDGRRRASNERIGSATATRRSRSGRNRHPIEDGGLLRWRWRKTRAPSALGWCGRTAAR